MEQNKKRVYKSVESQREVVDMTTGEVMSASKEQIEMGYVDAEPQYIKVYLDCVLKFKGISSSFNPILLSLCKHMQYADKDQIVFVNKYIKDLICRDCDVSLKRVEQAINQFVKVGILVRKARGVYAVNPYIISRGKWEDVKKLRATFDFVTGDIKLDTNVEVDDTVKLRPVVDIPDIDIPVVNDEVIIIKDKIPVSVAAGEPVEEISVMAAAGEC